MAAAFRSTLARTAVAVLPLLAAACGGQATEPTAAPPSPPTVTPSLVLAYSTSGTRVNVARNVTVTSSLAAAGGQAPYVWALASGALPPGMSLATGGTVVGTSGVPGAYSFSVRAADARGTTGVAAFDIIVNTPTLAGSVSPVTITGPVTRRPVTFTVYLPPNYNASSTRYPVIYHFHGINGGHNGNQISLVPLSLEAAVSAGLMEPAIVVFPDGYGDSFWSGSASAAKPAEANVVEEIIPYIDRTYRTIARRERRVVQGFSMGGFGAAKFATKFPELFGVCVVYDGAMLDWPALQQVNAQQAAEVFAGSAAVFDQFSPYFWLNRNAVQLRGSLPFRDAVGALVTHNDRWRDALTAASATSTSVYTGLPHALGPLLDAQGANSWEFIRRRFIATP